MYIICNMSKAARILATLCTLSGLTAIACLAYREWREWRERSRRRFPDPNKWQRLGTVGDLTMFPVKSGSAYHMHKCNCDEFGLSLHGIRDRHLIVYRDDSQRSLVWAGNCPRMLNVQTAIAGRGRRLKLVAPNMPRFEMNSLELLDRSADAVIVKQKRGYQQKLIKCIQPANQWISEYILGHSNGLSLYVQKPPILQKSRWRTIECDYMPILVMHDKSVADLNTRLWPRRLTNHHQFRGNIFIASEDHIEPFDEDNWQWLKIGNDVVLRFAAICRRCIVPNENLGTYLRNVDFEPLRTLKTYRLISNSKDPDMGVYFEVFSTGTITEGDPVYVQYRNT